MLTIEADLDPGLPSRVLDLFAAQNRLPSRFDFDVSGSRLHMRLDVGDLPAAGATVLLARIQRIPGVRSAQAGQQMRAVD